MSLPNEETVRRVLAVNGRDARIRACIEQSWEHVTKSYPDRPKWRRKSTTRALMWEATVEAVGSVFDGDRGIRPIAHHDTVSFVADDTVLFRLKKAQMSLLTTNYPTLLARMFHTHAPDMFGHEGLQRVEIVHVFNRFQTRLEWIGVVARDKKKVIWQYELPVSGAAVTALPTTPPVKPASDTVLRPAATSTGDEAHEEKK